MGPHYNKTHSPRGQVFRYIPALNNTDAHIEMLANFILSR
jgi:protoheme ferro-lyase